MNSPITSKEMLLEIFGKGAAAVLLFDSEFNQIFPDSDPDLPAPCDSFACEHHISMRRYPAGVLLWRGVVLPDSLRDLALKRPRC